MDSHKPKFKTKSIIEIILPIGLFLAGYFTHFFISNSGVNVPFVSSVDPQVQKILSSKPSNNQSEAKKQAPLTTKVTYDGSKFDTGAVYIEVTRYLVITNISKDKFLWLASDDPDFNLDRGFGEDEVIQAQMNKVGNFKIVDKKNPQNVLNVYVKQVI